MVENDKAELLHPMERAEQFRSSLDPTKPSFVVAMVSTHVVESFTVTIPSEFSAKNMPKKDFHVTLLDEEEKEQIVEYHTNRHRLGRGWRPFSKGHNLTVGDAVVFRLMEINKFKLYIIRKTGLAAVDGAFGCLQPEACAQKSSPGKAGALQPEACAHKNSLGKAAGSDLKDIGRIIGVAEVDGALQPEACAHKSSLGKAGHDMKLMRKTVPGKRKRLPLSVIEGGNENISPSQSVIDQPVNCCEEVASECLGGIRFASYVPEFEDIKNFESFTIIYDDLIIDSEIPEHVRTRYYKLCCSQKLFLHKTLLPGLNCQLVAGLISETVNIADAIAVKSSRVSSTSRDVFQVWKKSLEASTHFGMNVGFLLALLDELMKMASESDQAVDLSESKKSSSSKSGKEIKSKRTVKKKKMHAVDILKRGREAIVE